ncbi:MAG: NERD domain-containing protein [Ruminococcaceae bacterium]|nr:NERD domain-containing protein [Oscillospiraceae bacterium]
MSLENNYKQLTGIDINEQKKIWDERGRGYYGEYLVFSTLYSNLKGTGKILMNLNVPTEGSKTTEIDLLLMHETGLYVFEIKHYKGTIYGKDTDKIWTQYFRSSPNQTFKNPFEQNGYHIRAIKKLLPDIPIHSIVVFTNDECELKISNQCQEIDVCHLNDVLSVLEKKFSSNQSIFSMDQIDAIFDHLALYSQMQEDVIIEDEIAPFSTWISPIINKFEDKIEECNLEKEKYTLKTKELKKSKIIGRAFNIFIAVICLILTGLAIVSIQKGYDLALSENETELALFKQKFLHIDEINNEYIDVLNSYVSVSNINLSPLTDDAVSFSASLTLNNDIYNITLQKDAKFIVMTKSGKIYEYDIFGESLKYNEFSNTLGKHYGMSKNFAKTQFYGISNPKDITYIKVINVRLSKLDTTVTVIKDNLELELYSKKS